MFVCGIGFIRGLNFRESGDIVYELGNGLWDIYKNKTEKFIRNC